MRKDNSGMSPILQKCRLFKSDFGLIATIIDGKRVIQAVKLEYDSDSGNYSDTFNETKATINKETKINPCAIPEKSEDQKNNNRNETSLYRSAYAFFFCNIYKKKKNLLRSISTPNLGFF